VQRLLASSLPGLFLFWFPPLSPYFPHKHPLVSCTFPGSLRNVPDIFNFQRLSHFFTCRTGFSFSFEHTSPPLHDRFSARRSACWKMCSVISVRSRRNSILLPRVCIPLFFRDHRPCCLSGFFPIEAPLALFFLCRPPS